MFNRRIAIAAFALGCSALALAAPASAQTKWNLPAAYPADNPHSENLVLFAKDVETATGGKLQITVHPGAALFKAPEIKRAVASGQAQMGEVLISLHENEDPVFGIDVVPFLATSFADSLKLYKASKAAVEKKLDSQGVKLLFMVPWAPQGVYTKKELSTIDDMKGLKWRAYNVGTARLGELLGMQSVTIQAAELPQALATGVVNSFMSSGGTGYDSKAWETLTHFYDVQAWIREGRHLRQQGRFRRARQADAGGDPEGRRDGRGARLEDVGREDQLVSRPAQGQGHEGAGPVRGARRRLQEGRRDPDRRLAEEGRRRRPGDRRRLQEDVRLATDEALIPLLPSGEKVAARSADG
jgi:TRAP-type C4-dicarboxylate transport system substrate-binding protein